MPDSLTAQLVALLQRPISPQDRQRVCLHLLDWLGCALLGCRSRAATAVKATLMQVAGSGKVTALTHGDCDPVSALLLNAAVGNVEEMDDIHRTSILHPGPVIVPAALAAAQLHGASAKALLDAVIKGYEVTIRIGRALAEDHYRFFHNTSTCGAFGAAAAVADILQLSVEQRVWALGNAGTRTGGLWQMRHEGVMSKQWHNAEAARSGYMAAYLASQGFTGPAMILEGPQGLFAATSPMGEAARVMAQMGAPWLMHETSFKPWPACRHAHASIDAALALGLSTEEVAGIDCLLIESYRDALVFCDRAEPVDEAQAKFSLQHAVAVALIGGKPTLDDFKPQRIADEKVRTLRRKIHVEESPDLTARYPQHYGANIEVTFGDGSKRVVYVGDAKGDPENPMAAEEIKEKAEALMAAADIGKAPRTRLIELALRLDETETLDHFFAALRSLAV